MKRLLIMLAAMLPLFAFVGCSDDDETKGDDKLSLNKSEVKLYVGDTESLEANKNVDWSTDNEFVASVNSDGLVEGIHVGKAIIEAKSETESAKCEIEVEPQYNTYVEPVLDFGSSADEIKSKENRNLLSEDENGIVFDGSNDAELMVVYTMDNNRMTSAGVAIDFSYTAELVDFLAERYQLIGEEDGLYIYIDGEPSNFNMGVGLSVQSGYLLVSYTPNQNTKSSDLSIYKNITDTINNIVLKHKDL